MMLLGYLSLFYKDKNFSIADFKWTSNLMIKLDVENYLKSERDLLCKRSLWSFHQLYVQNKFLKALVHYIKKILNQVMYIDNTLRKFLNRGDTLKKLRCRAKFLDQLLASTISRMTQDQKAQSTSNAQKRNGEEEVKNQ